MFGHLYYRSSNSQNLAGSRGVLPLVPLECVKIVRFCRALRMDTTEWKCSHEELVKGPKIGS
jgi:hypothetical protein